MSGVLAIKDLAMDDTEQGQANGHNQQYEPTHNPRAPAKKRRCDGAMWVVTVRVLHSQYVLSACGIHLTCPLSIPDRTDLLGDVANGLTRQAPKRAREA